MKQIQRQASATHRSKEVKNRHMKQEPMELPEILQDDKAVKTELTELIQQRYQLTIKDTPFNFQRGEFGIVDRMAKSDELINAAQELLTIFLNNRTENGYCYFTLKSCLQDPSQSLDDKITALKDQSKKMANKQSNYHKINHLILMREILLSKLEGKRELNKEVEEHIDDVRFISSEILQAIQKWRADIQCKGINESIVYIYKGQNYPTKIIVDTKHIIDNINGDRSTFLHSPNPFFIPLSSQIPNIRVPTLNKLLEILSQEKARELKMMIQSPFFKAQKGVRLEQELKKLRNKVEDSKAQQIKTIYQNRKSLTREVGLSQVLQSEKKIEKVVDKNKDSIKNLDKLIKQKELQVLKQIKKKKLVPQKEVQLKETKNSNNFSGFKTRIQSLRAEVEKNINANRQKTSKHQPRPEQIKNILPKVEADLKSAKPKIKIVCERDVPVENMTKNIIDMMLADKNIMSRSRSTFYKQVKVQEEKQAQADSAKAIMINSAYSFKSLPSHKMIRSTSVNFKLRSTVHKGLKAQKERSRDKSQTLSRQEQVQDVAESLNALSKKIREQSIRNIYSRQSRHNVSASATRQKASLPKSKEKSEVKDQILNSTETINLQTEYKGKLSQKQKYIDTLKQKLRQLQKQNQRQSENVVETGQIRQQTEDIAEKLTAERQRLQLQSLRLKEQMKMQQIKYLSLKEQEYKIKQEELEVQYKRQLQKLKENLTSKQHQFEARIEQERAKNKEVEDKLKEVAKVSESIRMQLQEKEIKEQLMAQLVREETLRKQRLEEQRQQKQRNQALLEEIQRQQERYRKQLQKKALQNFEQEKIKLQALHLEVQKRNLQLQAQNQQRLLEIERIQSQKKKEEQQLQRIRAEISAKDENNKLQHILETEAARPISKSIHLPAINSNTELQLQELKQKIKQQLIEQLKLKRQLEEEQERKYEEERRKHLQELQEQLRVALRAEDEEVQKIEEQYRRKNEQMIRDFEQEQARRRQQMQSLQAQKQSRLNNLQHNQPFQLQRLVAIQTGLQDELNRNDNKQIVKQAQDKKGLTEKPDQIVHQTKNLTLQNETVNQIQQPVGQPSVAKREGIEALPDGENIEGKEKVPIQNSIQNTQKSMKQPQQKQSSHQQHTTIKSQIKPPQTMKQSSEQVRKKYDCLLSLVTKPIKQIFIAAEQTEAYLNRYYSLLAPEVKEMLPFSRKQLETIFKTRKVDILDNFSFGWYRPQQKKFLLLGSFEAIPILGGKYGEIQVQQVFIFNKGNAYQKQFLTRLIKIYEKIGYIFQKKTSEEGKYSIKFIVKVPKEANPRDPPTDQLLINTALIVQPPFKQAEQSQQWLKSNCFYYLLTQSLREGLGENQKTALAGNDDFESKYINKRINDEPIDNTLVATQYINDKVIEVKIALPIQYLLTAEQTYYSLKAKQYELTGTNEKLYVVAYPDHKLAIVIHRMQSGDVPAQFNLENFLQSKLRRMEEEKQLQLFLPLWENNIVESRGGDRAFTYRQDTRADLVYGSVVSSKVRKEEFVYVEPPFVFVVFELNSAQVLRRIVFGHIVRSQEVIRTKRVVAAV